MKICGIEFVRSSEYVTGIRLAMINKKDRQNEIKLCLFNRLSTTIADLQMLLVFLIKIQKMFQIGYGSQLFRQFLSNGRHGSGYSINFFRSRQGNWSVIVLLIYLRILFCTKREFKYSYHTYITCLWMDPRGNPMEVWQKLSRYKPNLSLLSSSSSLPMSFVE